MQFVGDGKFQFGISVVFAGYGFAFRDVRALRTASQTVEAILACGAVVQLLKHVTGREEPFLASKPGGKWTFFPNQISYFNHVPSYDSYPSGHIATAMTTLIVIAQNYPELTWLLPVGYPILAVVATSLVTTSGHWWGDIPLGVALGYSFGIICAHQLTPEVSGSSISASLEPAVIPGGAGLSLAISF